MIKITGRHANVTYPPVRKLALHGTPYVFDNVHIFGREVVRGKLSSGAPKNWNVSCAQGMVKIHPRI